MIQFRFSLSSKKYPKESLLKNYTKEYLQDWLSFESELKYLFYFESYHEDNSIQIISLEDSIRLLRQDTFLTNDEKTYLLHIYINDAYVKIDNHIAYLFIELKSEYHKQEPNEKIIKFLCNHIYNQCEYGFLQYGIIEPLTEEKRKLFTTTYELVSEKKFPMDGYDFLYLNDYSYDFETLSDPIYVSKFNLECYRISKEIEEIEVELDKYKKKRKELKQKKKELYIHYRDEYITMISNMKKLWFPIKI